MTSTTPTPGDFGPDPIDTSDPTVVEATLEGWEGGYRIENDSLATWALRKRAERLGDVEASRQLAQAERDRIAAWEEHVTAQPLRDVAFFDAILLDYARRQRAEAQRKSISTPYGTLRSRTSKRALTITDEAQLLTYLEGAHPELVRTTVKAPTLTDLRAAFELPDDSDLVVDPATGEVLPGVTVEPEAATFWIER